jgi:hypothetical protein
VLDLVTRTHIERLGTEDPHIASFWDCWNGLPKRDLVPRLSDYLDGASPHLQPSVVIADVYSPDILRMRLFATRLVEIAGMDLTGLDSLSVYARDIRKRAGTIVHESANHPCGYLSIRYIRTYSGRMIRAPGICLPLLTDRPDSKTVVNFTSLPEDSKALARDDKIELVQGLELVRWIDIGHGLPDVKIQ